MRKRWYRRFLIIVLLLVSIIGTGFSVEELQAEQKQFVSTGDVSNKKIIPGGMPIGIYMKADGILVLGTDHIEGKDGEKYNPAENIVCPGDYIVAINGVKVDTKTELIKQVEKLKSKEVILKIRRKQEEIEVKFKAVLTKDEKYKLGIWVRDSIQGLGTITYITQDNKFGALGHGIHDTDTDELLELGEGKIYDTKIINIEKGKKGNPGGMEGMIVYSRHNILGTIDANTDIGIYGTINNLEALTKEQEALPICTKRAVKVGAATIRCYVDGKVEEYDIEIEKTNYFAFVENKAITIKVVDKKLLEITGGIVQGMSGSPIIQNGKLVGAVTHVLVNDPTRGYGIFIENMLETANQVAEEQAKKDAS